MKYTSKQLNWHWVKGWLLGLSAVILVTISINTGQSLPRSETLAAPAFKGTAQDSLDKTTGLILAPGFAVVKTTCVKCHSPKLITGKRATREGWLATIRWMQQTQGLWDLGKAEPVILDYLARNYAPKKEGRRPPLKITEWYKLNE